MSLSVRDLEEEMPFQRKEWVAERVGWSVIVVVVVAAAVGVFGVGPLSEVKASEDDAVSVEYERFGRQMGMDSLTIELGRASVSDGTATVFIEDDLLGPLRVESISPQPDTETARKDGTVFEFSAEAESPPVVEIVYRPETIGLHRGVVRAGQADGVELWQLVYP